MASQDDVDATGTKQWTAPGFPVSRDFEFFYRGLAEGRLLVQQCGKCGALRNPPCPMCPSCRSLAWQAVDCDPRGKVHSYVVHHHPGLIGHPLPHTIVLADMANGLRLVGGMEPGQPRPEIGAPVVAVVDTKSDVPSFRFRSAA